MTNPAFLSQPWWPEHVATMQAWLHGERTSQADIQTWMDRCGSQMGPGFAEATAGLLAETNADTRRQACMLVALMTHVGGPVGAISAASRKAPREK